MTVEPGDYERFMAELSIAIDSGMVAVAGGFEYSNETAVDEVVKLLERWGLIIYTDVN